MTPLDRWISKATRKLSPESAASVREEIQQHCDSSREAGADDAVAALGDPAAANRQYRKVLLTEQEAIMAPVLTRRQRPNLLRIVTVSALLAVFLRSIANKYHSPGFWPIMIGIFCLLPITWFFPLNTVARRRTYLYLHVARSLVVVALAWWYQGWISALVLAGICFSLDYFTNYRSLIVLRKLAAGQTYNPLPGEPELTHLEAIRLGALRMPVSPYENVSIGILFLILAGLGIWMPATFAPMAVWVAGSFVAGRILPIYTEQRSRWFRIAKWTTMGIAAVAPVLCGARVPWIGAPYLAFFWFFLDKTSISLRRKLPVGDWPKRLYW